MARRAGSEHGTDATPEHPTDRSGEALPTDLPNDPAPEAIDPPFEDPALGVDTLSEEGAGAVPLDPSRTDTPEFLRPDEPADALVVGATDPAEEASPVRFWEADAGPADQEASDFRATSPDASNSDGDLAGRTIEDRTDDQPGERDDAAVPPTRTEPFAGHEGIATAERSVLPPPASARRGGLGALLLGGLIAAALGFGAAWLAQDRFGGARLPADLEERLAALEARPVPDGSEVQALDERITGIESRLAALEEARHLRVATQVEDLLALPEGPEGGRLLEEAVPHGDQVDPAPRPDGGHVHRVAALEELVDLRVAHADQLSA